MLLFLTKTNINLFKKIYKTLEILNKILTFDENCL